MVIIHKIIYTNFGYIPNLKVEKTIGSLLTMVVRSVAFFTTYIPQVVSRQVVKPALTHVYMMYLSIIVVPWPI
jgi:hypothetical protein